MMSSVSKEMANVGAQRCTLPNTALNISDKPIQPMQQLVRVALKYMSVNVRAFLLFMPTNKDI